jgi:hypothetical protein
LPDSTWETVVGLTPAWLATWAIVTREGGPDSTSLLDMGSILLRFLRQNDLTAYFAVTGGRGLGAVTM